MPGRSVSAASSSNASRMVRKPFRLVKTKVEEVDKCRA